VPRRHSAPPAGKRTQWCASRVDLLLAGRRAGEADPLSRQPVAKGDDDYYNNNNDDDDDDDDVEVGTTATTTDAADGGTSSARWLRSANGALFAADADGDVGGARSPYEPSLFSPVLRRTTPRARRASLSHDARRVSEPVRVRVLDTPSPMRLDMHALTRTATRAVAGTSASGAHAMSAAAAATDDALFAPPLTGTQRSHVMSLVAPASVRAPTRFLAQTPTRAGAALFSPGIGGGIMQQSPGLSFFAQPHHVDVLGMATPTPATIEEVLSGLASPSPRRSQRTAASAVPVTVAPTAVFAPPPPVRATPSSSRRAVLDMLSPVGTATNKENSTRQTAAAAAAAASKHDATQVRTLAECVHCLTHSPGSRR
jgi:hypothetical protein